MSAHDRMREQLAREVALAKAAAARRVIILPR